MRHLHHRLSSLLLAPFLLTAAAAGAEPARLPPALAEAVRPHLVADGVDPGALATWDGDYARTVDLSPDGVADWVLDYNALGFPGWCGTGGCRHQVWVSQGRGYVLALDEWVGELTVRAGEAHTLDLDLHGTHCREPGNSPCLRSFAWNAATATLEEVPNAEGGSLLTGPLFQAVPTDPLRWPAPVRQLADAVVDACTGAGGEALEWNWPANSLPDLDGDGVRDWALDESWLLCRRDDDDVFLPARLHVFVSRHGRWTEQLDVPDAAWSVDVSSRPASLVLTPSGE